MTLTTYQTTQQNHERIMKVLENIEGKIAVGVMYDIMDHREPSVTLLVKSRLSALDTKLIYDNGMTIRTISHRYNSVYRAAFDDKDEDILCVTLTYPFANPFGYHYESKYLYIGDDKTYDLVFLKYCEMKEDGTRPENKDQIYSVNFIVLNLSDGGKQQILSVAPQFKEEILDAISRLGSKLTVTYRSGKEEHSSRFYFEQIPLEHARPEEVV
jgi:hypothetical protein